jgi:hypothetical protein
MTEAEQIQSHLASLAVHFARQKSDVTRLMNEARAVWSERAAIREYEGAQSRPTAEREALTDTVEIFNAQMLRGRR